jgi:hypothetical protein
MTNYYIDGKFVPSPEEWRKAMEENAKKEEPSQLMPGGNPHWVDMVEVVRCQDCVHCHEVILTHWCNWWEDVAELNGYCSYGERREK